MVTDDAPADPAYARVMPIIVVGADTPPGSKIVDALLTRDGEVRAFVTDLTAAEELKQLGVKTAIGDVSDGSHVGGAALNCFSAVLVPDAASDDRERAFADDPGSVVAAWAEGLRDAGVNRVLWIGDRVPDVVADAVPESVAVPLGKGLGQRVREIDDLPELH